MILNLRQFQTSVVLTIHLQKKKKTINYFCTYVHIQQKRFDFQILFDIINNKEI